VQRASATLDEMSVPHPDLELLFTAKTHDLGDGLVVGRALPQAGCRAVGPVVFLDHMGPSDIAAGKGFDVRPHPHIGLATVTYLFEGEIVHRDSLGFVQPIRPGAVNVMVAGKGIVHSERASDQTRREGGHLHGIQLWIALPTHDEECDPSFVHHASATLPSTEITTPEGAVARVRVLLGEAWGVRSPAVVSSRPFFAIAELNRGARLEVPRAIDDVAIYLASGGITIDDVAITPRQLAVRAEDRAMSFVATEPSRVVLVGGPHLEGVRSRNPRHLEWNFVSSSKERLEDAKRRWVARAFPTIPGDDQERIPLPGE